jgi:hypothetical protein
MECIEDGGNFVAWDPSLLCDCIQSEWANRPTVVVIYWIINVLSCSLLFGLSMWQWGLYSQMVRWMSQGHTPALDIEIYFHCISVQWITCLSQPSAPIRSSTVLLLSIQRVDVARPVGRWMTNDTHLVNTPSSCYSSYCFVGRCGYFEVRSTFVQDTARVIWTGNILAKHMYVEPLIGIRKIKSPHLCLNWRLSAITFGVRCTQTWDRHADARTSICRFFGCERVCNFPDFWRR